MLKDIVKKSRSYRRFYQDVAVTRKQLVQLVDLARLSPTGGNRQPLKFYISYKPEKNAVIFQQVAWAGQLNPRPVPVEGERPAAYIIILRDKQVTPVLEVDHAIAAQTILLGATEMGLGGCMLGSAKKEPLRQALALPERYEILLAVAIGKPKEKVVIDTISPDGDTAYWREPDSTHHVPKRKLEDLILE